METFEFSHQIPRTVEFVNGSYTLTAIKTLELDGKIILYCLGEATLDNSCCGLTNSSYGLVIGELISTREGAGDLPVSTVSRIVDANTEDRVRALIQNAEQLETVNFYLPA